MSGKSRIEKILENLLGENNVIEPPIGRDEKILYSILNDLEYTEPPHSIFEELLLAIKNSSPLETEYAYDYLTRDEKILFCKLNSLEYFEPPHSRLEKLLIKWLYLDLYLNIDGVPPFTFISNGSPLLDYIISGNTVQSSTPTPDSPIMPEGTGERTGNLIPEYPTQTKTLDGVNWNVSSDGKITGSGITTSGTNFYLVNNYSIPLKAGTYTLSFVGRKNILMILRNKTTMTTICAIWSTNSSATFTIDDDIPETDRIILYFNTSQVGTSVDIDGYPMLNTGSTPLPYEPYGIKIPISSANTTTPVYLGEVQSTRRIKKLVLTGEEGWVRTQNQKCYYINASTGCPTDYLKQTITTSICSHYQSQNNTASGSNEVEAGHFCFYTGGGFELYIGETTISSAADFKSYLAQQYANGTPVTVWYVLATETTGIVNEPLMKIGDYADSINYEQTVVSIPTVSGRNTFDVLGDVKPSNVELTYAPRAPLLGKRKTILKK